MLPEPEGILGLRKLRQPAHNQQLIPTTGLRGVNVAVGSCDAFIDSTSPDTSFTCDTARLHPLQHQVRTFSHSRLIYVTAGRET